eukprot:gene6861-8848_t
MSDDARQPNIDELKDVIRDIHFGGGFSASATRALPALPTYVPRSPRADSDAQKLDELKKVEATRVAKLPPAAGLKDDLQLSAAPRARRPARLPPAG